MELTTKEKRKKYLQRTLGVVAILIALNMAASYIHGRWDLTAEKRYTLAASTRQLLRQLDAPVYIEVYLKGQYPAGFRQLGDATRELLEEFQEYGGKNIRFSFVSPGTNLPDSLRMSFQDSLMAKGILPFNLQVQENGQDSYAEKLIFPGATIRYKDRENSVNLLKSQGGMDPMQALNSSVALLEYKFANAIYQLQQTERPLVGYMLGHGEPEGPNIYDALKTLHELYQVDTINLKADSHIPREFDAILFVRPLETFTDEDKLKIDQYVMNGGKVLWFIDNLTASADSLRGREFVAFDRNLQLEDLLFKYGARVNLDLVQDLQSDMIPLVVGNIGDKPQIRPIPFPFFPLLTPGNTHPIVKNMDLIMSRFASSIDTMKGGNIHKTILLATSDHSRTLGGPVQISLESVQQAPNRRDFRQRAIPVAVLLEGRFPSLFNHRLSRERQQALESASGLPFKAVADTLNRMIVVGDADIVTNALSQKEGPLQMGVNEFNPQYVFANKEFFLNSMEYLTSKTPIMDTRSKELTLRLLDGEKLKKDKTLWQVLAFALPIGAILLFAMVFQFIRQRKYA
ncbi:gliding motility-associated ABC transporter substrate-binding protein GldG [Chitinophaga alhagiae]|uniref:Gliding motility-associated ABC transporter substrate-binding protein GldG n=1 Tax=Chitinophaga alhagiae TaxID=2203219 RepID=A0ABM6WD99_9BACT|nr:gliding motility-associated ABC transporter substrate-binding protein GldG [Chitinophaga alhagiae]AWO01871.1 gliding motility-associated ABC transporter substrate-binding protein GldG [Chitinophaga alhagiae]